VSMNAFVGGSADRLEIVREHLPRAEKLPATPFFVLCLARGEGDLESVEDLEDSGVSSWFLYSIIGGRGGQDVRQKQSRGAKAVSSANVAWFNRASH
jgi:hypothetical protein